MDQELPGTLLVLIIRLSGIEDLGFIKQLVMEAEHLLILVESWSCCWSHVECALNASVMD